LNESAQPSEEELRARLEEELRKITVQDVLLQSAVSLINLGGQRLGLTEQTRDARDLEQARVAIEAVRALMPLIEERGDTVQTLRDALAQLQLAYANEAGSGGEPEAAKPERAPPARGESREPDPQGAPEQPRTSRLWTPPGSG
jgi:hypothetical protein